ncbi:MAG: hypothetical protein M1818_001613 [Claussenomyces sp. TS43310]|nr:MAG: hypothetical protein M1818_001613 [Claussenomyces sp. TS43310]
MNNSQFRKLLLETPARQGQESQLGTNLGVTPKRDAATPSTLGSRMRSSIPMTPRSVATAGGVDFARQLAERNATSQPTKRFRSAAAPKGAKLAAGYTDRTKQRVSEEEDDKASRVKALEEMMKLQQIDQATFEKLRDEIVGGDIESVHLVKGLDYRLLERVRRGEAVLDREKGEDASQREDSQVDVDDELSQLEDQEIAPLAKEKSVKKGEMAPPSLIPGKKRSRDQILAELKAARLAAKEKAAPSLGTKFKKVGAPRTESRIERDGKGREILITVDEHGNEKRKVRRVQVEPLEERGHDLLMPDKDAAPLGMAVPHLPKSEDEGKEEDRDLDIFDDAGDVYDPLAGLDDDDDDGSNMEDGKPLESEKLAKDGQSSPISNGKASDSLAMPPPPRPKTLAAPAAARNYFGDSKSEAAPAATSAGAIAMTDPTILAALKKASTLQPIAKVESEEERAREEKRKRMLQMDDRDAQDMDMGFGSSRFEDEEDFGDEKIKLSQWKGQAGDDDDDDDDEGAKAGGKSKRKRGPKKRKGDANSAADVMKVLERRKAAGS